MLDLTNLAKIEKNRLQSDGAFIILLKINLGEQSVNVCRNTENITWNGELWYAFPFEFDAPTQSCGGELPSFNIRVSNVTRAMQGWIEPIGGAVGMTIKMYVVLAKADGSVMQESYIDEEFTVHSTSFDEQWVTFKASGIVNIQRRIPERRYLKNFCPFQYKGPECRASSAQPTCNKSLNDCRLRGNAKRFGGEPGIPEGGMYDKRN